MLNVSDLSISFVENWGCKKMLKLGNRRCISSDLDVTFPPTDMPWSARKIHLQISDGHVFRISKSKEE